MLFCTHSLICKGRDDKLCWIDEKKKPRIHNSWNKEKHKLNEFKWIQFPLHCVIQVVVRFFSCEGSMSSALEVETHVIQNHYWLLSQKRMQWIQVFSLLTLKMCKKTNGVQFYRIGFSKGRCRMVTSIQRLTSLSAIAGFQMQKDENSKRLSGSWSHHILIFCLNGDTFDCH